MTEKDYGNKTQGCGLELQFYQASVYGSGFQKESLIRTVLAAGKHLDSVPDLFALHWLEIF